MSNPSFVRKFLAKIISLAILVGISYGMYTQIEETTPQYVIIVSLVVFIAVLYIYSLLRGTKSLDILEDDEKQDVAKFEDITLDDVIQYWHRDQQKGLTGIFRSIPDIDEISEVEKSELVEVELDVEHLIVETSKIHTNWNSISGVNFYTSPYPAKEPNEFVNEQQVFPMDGTLEKVTCSSCGGRGKTSCTTCSGTGKTRCSRCGGTGSITTTEYSGYGSDRTSRTVRRNCMSCSAGSVTCMSCSGSGRQTCNTCGGSGAFGQYYATVFNFLHWQNQRLFKITDDNTIVETPVEDIENQYAQELPAFENGEFKPLTRYKLVPQFEEKVNESIKELQISSKTIENELFHEYSLRRMPELNFQVNAGGNTLNLTARGFRPYTGQQSELDDFPLSKLKISLAVIFYGLYAFINYVLIFIGLEPILDLIENL